MTGQTNLQEVLDSMQVSCDEVKYGFATVEQDGTIDFDDRVLGAFRETEGLTLIADVNYLDDKAIEHEGPFAKLTIDVHTSLELVGLTAVLATKLADNNISANVVAAYFHDHVFVQHTHRDEAISVLQSLKTLP